ncbi:MAG: tyrosine-type recombinase/integrase, partial [Acidimicrobiales bacterium]
RDAQMVKTAYAFGLRRAELCRLELADLRPNPHVAEWGTYGSVHVRYGKAIKGGVPRRRTVLAVPEFDWVVAGLRQWVEEGRPILDPGDHQGLWVTERLTTVALKHFDKRFAWLRAEAGLGPALSLHCLRHSVIHLIEFGYPERFVQEQVKHYAGDLVKGKADFLQEASSARRVRSPSKTFCRPSCPLSAASSR